MPARKTPARAVGPANKFLQLIHKRVQSVRKDTPALSEMGEQMAGHLLAGGRIFAPPVCPFWPNEFGGRAGGMMEVHYHGPRRAGKHDVAFFVVPDPRHWDPNADESLKRLLDSQARLFVIGRREDLAALPDKKLARIEAFTGGADPAAGMYRFGRFDPLCPLRLFEIFLRGWVAAGEMIAACTRDGKMPVIWMSVWLEGSSVRNASMMLKNNLREPWNYPLFHDDVYIPPLPAGHVAGEFLGFVEGIHKCLTGQIDTLATAGRWISETLQAKHRVRAVLVGHSFPRILEVDEDPDKCDYPIEWGHSVSDLGRALPRHFRKGDLGVHLGYAPISREGLAKWMKLGARLIHTTPYGKYDDLPENKNFLWFDLPWRPTDATVDVPGYSVRILPGSSSAESMAFYALFAEAAERMGWK